ncbi:MAG: septal ring lytic transglycosylase RlpA family protein [Hyphomicrobium sp.]
MSSSPRIYGLYDPIPKGGGVYKTGSPYTVGGQWYVPKEEPNYDVVGTASWYGEDFHGRKTANGEIYDMNALSAAHPTLPMPSYVYVTNLDNGRTILVRVNDRGPYVDNRLIDLSYRTAKELGADKKGLTRVRVRFAGNAPLNGDDSEERIYLSQQTWSIDNNLVTLNQSSTPQKPSSALSPASWSTFQYRTELMSNTR